MLCVLNVVIMKLTTLIILLFSFLFKKKYSTIDKLFKDKNVNKF